MRILIVDDEPQITRVLRASLQSNGHEVTVAQDGIEALARFMKSEPELVITDLAMPGMDGIELTREIRSRSQVPIIVLSVRSQDVSKVAALDEGADDYITKPFSIQELLARVRVQSRRLDGSEPQASTFALGDFRIDVERRQVLVRNTEVHLTPKEFDLMLFFIRNADRVLTHKTLLRAVWGAAGADQPEYLRVLVAQLRKKIEPGGEPQYILSEPWVGYRLSPSPASADEARQDETNPDSAVFIKS
ncbi:MAG TPA: response regulator transcription factor [Acidobacteriaceae bacterium]|jgi:two-component system KDP operon response regulator KdpE|nr:response regulator transcription factor [Acidobacteriaceae bacterium]